MRLAYAMLLLLILPGLLLPAGITLRVCTCALEGDNWPSAFSIENADAACCCVDGPPAELPVASGNGTCSCCVRIALPSDDGGPKLPAERDATSAAVTFPPDALSSFDLALADDGAPATLPPRSTVSSPLQFRGAAAPLRI